MELRSLSKGYLQAEGYDVTERGKDLLVGARRTLGEDTEFIYVWVPKILDPASFRSQEGSFLGRFKEIDDIHPQAPKFMLVPTVEGMSREFLDGAKNWYNVRIRVPVQFFDTAFQWDESPEAASAAKEVRLRGEQRKSKRVEQPYEVMQDGESGGDLLETLFRRLHYPSEGVSTIHIVVGPAGIGKTILFEALFARLYAAFIADKKGQQLSARPLPLLPEYLPLSDASTIRALLRAYLQTDFARPITSKVFEWMMTNGLAMWLIDGLDEVISRDPGFFEYLLQLMTEPKGATSPTILICIRDSLLVTNEDFRDFCEEYSGHLTLYELKKWETASKKQFAGMQLGRDADEFMAMLRSQTGLDELASTPYYCHLLVDQFKSGQLRPAYSESDLLRDALSNIISREYDKPLLDRELVPEPAIIEFVEALAAEDMESGFQGIPVDVVRELAQVTLPSDLEESDLERLTPQMSQFALFSQGRLGHIRFAQEILEHFLLGQWLVRLFDNNPEAFLRKIAIRQIPADWITMRVVAEHVKEAEKFRDLLAFVYQSAERPIAFKNALQIAAFAAKSPNALRQVPFERQDLSGIVFDGLNFHEALFRECNLTDTEFHKCILTDANFEQAIISNTGFFLSASDALRGVAIGNLIGFYSMRVERGRLITEHAAAQKWFEQRTGKRSLIVEPCTAALQLRYLFSKFVYPDGSFRRSWLDMKGALAGKRFHDPKEVVQAAIRYGYLVPEEHRSRYKRSDVGDLYSEIVGYVTTLRITPGIKSLLNDVCQVEGCPHVPEAH